MFMVQVKFDLRITALDQLIRTAFLQTNGLSTTSFNFSAYEKIFEGKIQLTDIYFRLQFNLKPKKY